MPRQSIDYLNSRRESTGRKGRTIFAKASAAVDQRAQFNALDLSERTSLVVDNILEDFRSWANNLRPVAAIMGGSDDDWF
jgi:hypothetical protein